MTPQPAPLPLSVLDQWEASAHVDAEAGAPWSCNPAAILRLIAEVRAARTPAPPADQIAALEAAVSNALSAATEGGEYTEAPEPSDEPGSPYVKAIAARLVAANVRIAAPETGLREALIRAVVEWSAADDDLSNAEDIEAEVAAENRVNLAEIELHGFSALALASPTAGSTESHGYTTPPSTALVMRESPGGGKHLASPTAASPEPKETTP